MTFDQFLNINNILFIKKQTNGYPGPFIMDAKAATAAGNADIEAL